MSVVLIEGFDHYQASAAAAKGWSGAWTSMQTGRFGAFCARLNSGATGANRTRSLPTTYSTLYMGCAFRIDNGAGGTSGTIVYDIIAFRASGSNVVRLCVDASGHLCVKTSGGTTIATGTATIGPNTWYYVELKGVINGASGSCQVWLNGAQEIASTTGNFGSTNIDSVNLNATPRGGGFTLNVDFDDLYVLDTSGSANTAQLGDVRVETAFPTGDGANTAWTPSTGVNHYANVDESSGTYPNDDTDYNSDSNAGDRDTYTIGSLSANAGQIKAMQVSIDARKDDAGTHTIAPVVRHGGTNYDGTAQAVGATYAYYVQTYEAMPNGDALTKARVEAAEYGIKLVS